MRIDVLLNPQIFILGDLVSITNISKDQGHFILRASLIGMELILPIWNSAKEIKIDMCKCRGRYLLLQGATYI